MIRFIVFAGLAVARASAQNVLDLFAVSVAGSPVAVSDVYERPVVIVSPSVESDEPRPLDGTPTPPAAAQPLYAYYAHQGLRSLAEDDSFQNVYWYLRNSGDSYGFVFPSKSFCADWFDKLVREGVRRYILPDGFRESGASVADVPVAFIAPKESFAGHSFPGFLHIGSLSISEGHLGLREHHPAPAPGPGDFRDSFFPSFITDKFPFLEQMFTWPPKGPSSTTESSSPSAED